MREWTGHHVYIYKCNIYLFALSPCILDSYIENIPGLAEMHSDLGAVLRKTEVCHDRYMAFLLGEELILL